MNAAMHLSQPAMSASPARSVSPAPFDADYAEGVYAIWKSVFEHARPIEVSRDGACPSTDAERAPQGHSNVSGDMHDAAGGRGFANAPEPRGMDTAPLREGAAASSASRRSPSAITNVELDVSLAARQSLAAQNASTGIASAGATQTALLQGVLQSAGLEGSCIVPCDADMSKSSSEVTPQTAAAQPASPESVNVFVQGAAVAIVVRDAALSEQEAVRCAFETARKLTGQSASLQQLTLNGRTVYQQHSDSSTCAALPMAALVFAC